MATVLQSREFGNYAGVASLIPWVAPGSILWIAANVPVIALRTMQSPASVCCAHSASGAVAPIVGIPVIGALGLRGAVSGLIVSTITAFVVATLLLHRGCTPRRVQG